MQQFTSRKAGNFRATLLIINLVSALFPGLLHKIFQFKAADIIRCNFRSIFYNVIS